MCCSHYLEDKNADSVFSLDYMREALLFSGGEK